MISECKRYRYLNEDDRSVNNVASAANVKCDKNLVSGWYRFAGAAGTKMPETAPATHRCGTHAPGWLRGKHPTVAEGKVARTVCYHWLHNTCYSNSQIYVTNCDSFYVYYLKRPPFCNLRYCVEGAGKNLETSYFGSTDKYMCVQVDR